MPAALRPAAAEDAEELADLQIAAWRAGFSGILPPGYELPPREDFLAGADRAMRESGVVRTVAEVDGRIAGFCTHGPSRDADAGPAIGEIRALFVHPERWRTGVGAGLLTNALDDLRAEGRDEATLWSFDENEVANAFYEKLGFRRDGARERREALGGATVVRYRRGL